MRSMACEFPLPALLPPKPPARERRACGGPPSSRARAGGFSLIELLCSMAIIALLAGLFLGPASRALRRARLLKLEMEAPAHIERLTDGMRRFAGSRKVYECPDLRTLLQQAQPGAPTERWLRSVTCEFTPFNDRTPGDRVVLAIGVPTGRRDQVLGFLLTQAELTKIPE
ncbi:MAG: type II secretion system protein [Verrucomicrobia bacterium]|nr:type II secretion system protein [Verrucomicrobiota bacterium]